jgi:hypothetical protein
VAEYSPTTRAACVQFPDDIKNIFFILSGLYNNLILFILGLREEPRSFVGRGGGARRLFLRPNEPKKTSACSAAKTVNIPFHQPKDTSILVTKLGVTTH